MTEKLTIPLGEFKEREIEILDLMATGLSNREIAERLFITKETVRWYNKQIYSKLGTSRRIEAISLAREMGVIEGDESVSATKPKRRQHNLPKALKSFVGRQAELEALVELIPKHQVVTLLGIGGVGKSHLAHTAGMRLLDRFEDGVWFVPLANIDSTDSAVDMIALGIAGAMRVQLTNQNSPLTELVQLLNGQETLLILDNWEHLLGYAEEIVEALLEAEGVTILATSRARLNVTGEHLLPVIGLPDGEASELFVERAVASLPSFSAGEVMDEIVRLCRLVDGLPLGIELAAGWVEHFEIAEIRQSIVQISAEPQQSGQVVERHQSLSHVFEYSWRLLNVREQKVLSEASIFQGGFNRQAADQILQASLGDLSLLINHSLLRRVGGGRYDLHPLMQEFAASKLIHVDGLTRDHRVHYFAKLLQTDKSKFSRVLLPDFANLRQCWRSGIRQNDVAGMHGVVGKFGELIDQISNGREGIELYQEAIDWLFEMTTVPELEALFLVQQANFVRLLEGYPFARPIFQRILSLSENPEILIRTHLKIANGYSEEGLFEESDSHLFAAERIARRVEEPKLIAEAVQFRVYLKVAHFRADFKQSIDEFDIILVMLADVPDADAERRQVKASQYMAAIRYRAYDLALNIAEEALIYWRSIGHRANEINKLLQLSLAQQFAGFYEDSIELGKQGVALCEELEAPWNLGLLKANLCLTLRQVGRYKEALFYGEDMIHNMHPSDIGRIDGMGRNRVGHVYLEMEEWAEAEKAYQYALELWNEIDHPNRYEALAGLAWTMANLGRHDAALAYVNETLAYVETHQLVGFVEPAYLLANCAKVLERLGESSRAELVWGWGRDWIETVAFRIQDVTVRDVFLNNRPDNLKILAKVS